MRFEEALRLTHTTYNDSIVYIYWTQHSCRGCRKAILNMVNELSSSNIKIISPPLHADELVSLNSSNFLIDTTNFFGKKYFGIDNVGLIKAANNKVYSIQNYNPNEMDSLKKELQ